MLRLAFLASNRGSSMQAVVDAILNGRLRAQVCLIVSNKPTCKALEFGQAHGVVTRTIPTLPDPVAADLALCQTLTSADADLVILSGYLRKLGPKTISTFSGRILNVHPALLPHYGGQGMYGRRVHEAVVAAGETVTGATIHLVDGVYDHGEVIATTCVAVSPSDQAADVERQVMFAEERLVIETIRRFSEGELSLPLRR